MTTGLLKGTKTIVLTAKIGSVLNGLNGTHCNVKINFIAICTTSFKTPGGYFPNKGLSGVRSFRSGKSMFARSALCARIP